MRFFSVWFLKEHLNFALQFFFHFMKYPKLFVIFIVIFFSFQLLNASISFLSSLLLNVLLIFKFLELFFIVLFSVQILFCVFILFLPQLTFSSFIDLIFSPSLFYFETIINISISPSIVLQLFILIQIFLPSVVVAKE